MYILGIETATKTGGVSIISENGVLVEYTLNIEVTHSERLMSAVDRVLKDTGFTLANIDGYGVSIGPGSFTGLRIGLSTIKGLAITRGADSCFLRCFSLHCSATTPSAEFITHRDGVLLFSGAQCGCRRFGHN
jgi:tRNA threonylcarbamoyl adenosine modification protein YeaZ